MSDLQVIGTIDDDLAAEFKRELSGRSGPLTVHVDSEGGSVFAALRMIDALAAYRGYKTAVVEGAAFSAASYLLTAFDSVEVTGSAYIMAHRPYVEIGGTAAEMESSAALLRSLEAKMVKAYSRKMRKPEAEVAALLEFETFFDAEQAVAAGIADKIVGGSLVMAHGKRMSPLRRRAMVLAANRQREVATSKPVLQQAREAWSRAVASYREQGLSGADAVSRANKEHPLLRQVLVAAANMKRVH
jgi:ATP-dependent protease ClpP protease subunit